MKMAQLIRLYQQLVVGLLVEDTIWVVVDHKLQAVKLEAENPHLNTAVVFQVSFLKAEAFMVTINLINVTH